MLKKWIFGFFWVLCVIAAVSPACADGVDYQRLMDYLNQSFPDQYRVVANVSATNRNRFVFPQKELSLKKGQELLVLEQQDGTPVYLLPVMGVLQIENIVDHAYIARQVAAWGEKKPGIGDLIAIPVSPTIYLYPDMETKDGFALYQKLLQELIDRNYAVVELDSPEFKAPADKYGVLLRLEGSAQNLTAKVLSLYTGATLFSDTRPIAADTRASAVRVPADQASAVQSKEPKSFQTVDMASTRPILRLPERFNRLVICQADDSPEPEFALLNNEKIQVYHHRADVLEPAYAYEFNDKALIGLHLHAMDLNGDGQDELMVTLGRQEMEFGARTTKICSRILSFKDGRLSVLAENLPYYLRVIEDLSGKPVLLGQKKGEHDPYSGGIFEIRLKTGGGISAEVYGPASGIYSVYQFSFIPEFPENILIFEPSNFITDYHKATKTVAAVSDMSYGRFNIVSYPVKLEEVEFVGGFDNKITSAEQPAPRRFLLKTNYDNQIFTINKQRQTDWNIDRLKNLISEQKTKDNLVAFKCTGQYIRQTWESEKLSKDILDFSFMPGKNRDAIFVLVKDAQGFAVQITE